MLLGLTLADIIARIIVALIAMAVHEFAHVYVAYLAGDPTGANQGRLTLNPFVHIYWPGFITFVLIGFGILGLAPVDPSRMRNPRWGHLAAVAAGPLSNLALAIAAAPLLRFDLLPATPAGFPTELVPTPSGLVGLFITFNALLFVFNILPLFPLDGWTIVRRLLPYPASATWEKNRNTSQYVLFGLILLSFMVPQLDILGLVIARPTFALIRLLVGG